MEEWADEKQIDKIKENTDKLIRDYQAVVDRLKANIKNTLPKEKTEILMEDLQGMLRDLLRYSDSLDFERIDRIMSEIDGYKLPDNVREKMEQLKNAVLELNTEEIERLVKEVQEIQGWN